MSESPRRPELVANAATCTSCGAQIPSGHSRCAQCGEPAIRGERKLVTLLFADLTGYTALAARLDPEDVYSFVRPAMTDLRLIVEGFGGSVPQVMGDGFMAVFGAPTSHEDDAERAVRAALAIVHRARELNRRRTRDRFPAVHAGANTGEVLVVGSREPSGLAVVGDVVNMASRLADMAPPGRILVGERTRELTSHAIRYGHRRLRRAKGQRKPIATYEPIEARTLGPVGRIPSRRHTPFVGRQDILARLRQQLDEVRVGGRSRVQLISGDAGIGKTRLAAEFRAGIEGAIVIAGRCRPYGQDFPHAPLAEGLRELAGVSAETPLPIAEARVRRLIRGRATGQQPRSIARQISYFLGAAGLPDPIGSAAPGQEGWLAIRAVLLRLANERPVVVLVDDLQWADPDLVAILERAHVAPWSGPVFFVGFARPQMEAAAAGLPVIALEALDEEETRDMVDIALGAVVPERVAARLVGRSGGNPLFLEESIQMLVETGALVVEGGNWRVADSNALER
ncbi:MAG: AAA family ATPase, partial [Candidatus Limnocylindria bacterium]